MSELEEEARQSPFDAAPRELGQAIGQLDEAMRQPHEESPDHRRMCLEEREERSAGNEQALGRFERNRAGRIRPRLIYRDRANRVARTEDLQDDVCAARRRLEDLYTAADDGVQGLRRVALLEQHRTFGKLAKTGDGGQPLSIVGRQTAEQGAPPKRVVHPFGHMTRIIPAPWWPRYCRDAEMGGRHE